MAHNGQCYIQFSTGQAIWALPVGGTLIQPVNILLKKIMGLKVTANKDGSMNNRAMEEPVLMLMTIPMAYDLSLQQPEWFFKASFVHRQPVLIIYCNG
jgi:hypothetical protein